MTELKTNPSLPEIVLDQAGSTLTAAADRALSQRGLAAGFLIVASFLALAPWLRPPLSADLRAVHIPTGILASDAGDPEELLHGPRRLGLDRVGVQLLALIGGGLAVALWRPQRLGTVAGLLLSAAIAANAAVALNHPALIERLDLEYEQRRQMAALTRYLPERNHLLSIHNARVGKEGMPTVDEQRGDPSRGWVYLRYGRWLVLWAGAGVLLGSGGSMRHRLTRLGLWSLAGTILAGAVCSPRLLAEAYWIQANKQEAEGDPASARQSLEKSVELFPEFGQLERTWLLAGKLDWQQGRATPKAQFFQAFQHGRDKDWPRAVASSSDLPWRIAGATESDFGQRKRSSDGDVDPVLDPASQTSLDFRAGPWSPSLTRRDVLSDPNPHARHALALMEELLAEGQTQPAVRQQAARLWTAVGVRRSLHAPFVLAEDGQLYERPDRRLLAAEAAWRRAGCVAPTHRDSAFYLGTLQAHLNRYQSGPAEAEFAPALAGLGDRVLRADVLGTLGDASLQAGELGQARQRYAESFDAFNLPRAINYRAQKGLGGL